MHRFPDQHFPSLYCPRLEATCPMDKCGDLSGVKTDDAERCQYGNKSRSRLILRAKEPAIPFAFVKKKAKRKETVSKHTTASFYGGSLSFAQYQDKECAGFLFHPKLPDLKGLSVFPVRLEKVEEGDQITMRYKATTPMQELNTKQKSIEQLLQIETMLSMTDKGKIATALRCENKCHIVDLSVDTKSGRSKFKNSCVIECEKKPTSIALSPYIARECLISHEDGTIQMVDSNGSIQNITTNVKDKPCWSHYSSHPRIILAHQAKQLDLIDVRVGSTRSEKSKSKKSGSTCLLSLPSDLLALDQEIHVARQHPVNHFYHLVGTQNSLVLLDERFPKYHVLEWFHSLKSPPVCLDILNKALPTDDLVLMSSYTSAQSHCFQFSCLNGEAPVSTCPIWKASPMNSWLDLISEVPTCHIAEVKGYLHRPLIGTCTAQHTVGQGLDVFQVSNMGDIFQQTLIPSCIDDDNDITSIGGPGSEGLSNESHKICTSWLDEKLNLVETKQAEKKKTIGTEVVSKTEIMEELKQIAYPDPDCQFCCNKTSHLQDTPHPAKTPRIASYHLKTPRTASYHLKTPRTASYHLKTPALNQPKTPGTIIDSTCPACGIPIGSNLRECLKRNNIVTSEIIPGDGFNVNNDELPWEQLDYTKFTDDIGRMLLKDWMLNKTTGHEQSSQNTNIPWEDSQSLDNSQNLETQIIPTESSQRLETPLAHPSSPSISQRRMSPRRKALMLSQSQMSPLDQLSQETTAGLPRSPQKKITARRKLMNRSYTLGF